MTMTDPAPDSNGSSTTHLPWESIGEAGDTVGTIEVTPEVADKRQLPLTPWAEQDIAPDSTFMEDESGETLRPEIRDNGSDLTLKLAPKRAMAAPVPLAPLQSGGWTLPLLCAGIALIACCVLIPQADANRRLAYDRRQLQSELKTIESQVKVNAEFLKRVADDPTLAQRLAERQMKVIPEGAHVLELSGEQPGMSPFQLVNVVPPAPLPPYKALGGTLANVCYGIHSRLYLIGISLGMIATGLVLGYAPQSR
jgi:hypothetical protein